MAPALAAEMGDDARLCDMYKRIFVLRNEETTEAVDALVELFRATPSVLLRHEIAYVLGQMQLKHAEPFLTAVLTDPAEHPITRHEAAEALGAIGSEGNLDILRRFAADPAPEVAQTCELAVHRIEQALERGPCACERGVQGALARDAAAEVGAKTAAKQSVYITVDPAATPAGAVSLDAARATFSDERLPLHERYGAMFALRDMGTREAALALADGLRETSSALFRHEVAFVLGQLEHPDTAPQLQASLADADEHPMVRHEAAEALGAIGSEGAVELLRRYRGDAEPIVAESCAVALGMYDRDFFGEAGIQV